MCSDIIIIVGNRYINIEIAKNLLEQKVDINIIEK